jgi:hypothetical protein
VPLAGAEADVAVVVEVDVVVAGGVSGGGFCCGPWSPQAVRSAAETTTLRIAASLQNFGVFISSLPPDGARPKRRARFVLSLPAKLFSYQLNAP